MDGNLDFVQVAKIKVIGVGGGGCNAVARMAKDGVKGVDFYVANTDAQILKGIDIENKIVLGKELTHGLGAGGNPEVGRKAALETEEEIKSALSGANMVSLLLVWVVELELEPHLWLQNSRELGALTVGCCHITFHI